MDDRVKTVLKYAAGAAVISAAAVVAAKGAEYLADQSALKVRACARRHTRVGTLI